MKYAVFGHPIAHSQSPFIHRQFAKQEGKIIEYHKIFVDNSPEAFQAAVCDFWSVGGRGANVTVPFKELAYKMADECSEQAQAAGAVNTLILLEDGRVRGENTDGVGLVKDLLNYITLKNKKIVLLGAGGAVRGAILPLLMQQPESLTIVNRTHEKAVMLANQFGVQAATLAQAGEMAADVVINGTSSGLTGELPDVPVNLLARAQLVYDMVYGWKAGRFLQYAKDGGAAQVVDGLGMLVGQAAQSYALWRGFEPDILPVIMLLREKMADNVSL